MTDEEKSIELTRSSFAAQMAMLGYEPNGNPKDMVEVVRCKDCIYCKIAADKIWREDFCKSIYECDHLHLNYIEPDWFCADGERKDDDA